MDSALLALNFGERARTAERDYLPSARLVSQFAAVSVFIHLVFKQEIVYIGWRFNSKGQYLI